MVRINEFGEIVRDDPKASRGRPSPPPAPPPPPAPVRPSTDGPGPVILGSILLGVLLLGGLGALAGYGAGSHWLATESVEPAKWSKSLGSFFHCLFVASWSRHSVHHAIQDVTIPVRILLVVAAGIGVLVAMFGEKNLPSENEIWGPFVGLVFLTVLATMLTNALVRVLVYLLAHPATWFVNEISGPWSGAIVVGLCWAVIGAVIGLIAGIILVVVD
jgi:hypothetical protein